jgi:ADP-heptose:LPS heptosyltransferase
VERWQAALGERIKPRIGLVWSGSATHKNDHNRSIMLAKLLAHLPPNYEYISLQKELREGDQELLSKNGVIKYYGDKLQNFTDTAALCELLDLVISVDSSVAHLTGTMGIPTWLLLPYSPDWRWLLDRKDSPWYPSLKLYRQPVVDDWGSVFNEMETELKILFSTKLTK